jgi:hypothetical protein
VLIKVDHLSSVVRPACSLLLLAVPLLSHILVLDVSLVLLLLYSLFNSLLMDYFLLSSLLIVNLPYLCQSLHHRMDLLLLLIHEHLLERSLGGQVQSIQ